jgi:hypothetical protein
MSILSSFLFRFLSIFTLVSIVTRADAQNYPTHFFSYPMDTPLYLSAPFGSLRENHFHSGMDIRTYEKTGLPVYAVADGYIARIKYASGAYGKAIYINHPNGYTSVYAHLDNAHGDIATYIRKYQYEKQTFEFDHFPSKEILEVKKGDIIAWSGNTGTSSGPHLHFEIRDTKTEHIINPQLFGILGMDSLPPAIKEVGIYSLDYNQPMLIHNIIVKESRHKLTDSGLVLLDTLICNANLIGFALEGGDFLIDNKKEYSIYGSALSIDSRPYFVFKLDRFPFNRTRCINVDVDYERYRNKGSWMQKLFIDDGNNIRLYPFVKNKGKYVLKDTATHIAQLSVFDFNGKLMHVYVPFKKGMGNPSKYANLGKNVTTIYPQSKGQYKTNDFSIEFPSNSLYDTLLLNYTVINTEKQALSPMHVLGENLVPLQSSFNISILVDENAVKGINIDKLLIATKNKNGNIRYIGGSYHNGWVSASSNFFQDFFVWHDTISPVIKLVNTKSNSLTDTLSIKLQITDNLSGIMEYKGYINGKWELFEYDAKNALLTYNFVADSPKGKLEIEIIVVDRKNNKTILKTELTRI